MTNQALFQKVSTQPNNRNFEILLLVFTLFLMVQTGWFLYLCQSGEAAYVTDQSQLETN